MESLGHVHGGENDQLQAAYLPFLPKPRTTEGIHHQPHIPSRGDRRIVEARVSRVETTVDPACLEVEPFRGERTERHARLEHCFHVVKERHAANVDTGQQDLPLVLEQTMEGAPLTARGGRSVVISDQLLAALAPNGDRMRRMDAAP